MTDIDISGLDKAAVLKALYDAARPQGLGLLHYKAEQMTLEEARELLAGGHRFDYVHGRVLKVSLDGDALFAGLYDRDNGHGAAERALASLVRP